MKRTVKVKNLIAFAAVLILLFSITAIPAYAEFPPLTTAGRRLGSWILATLTAANITLTSTVAASQGADLINFLADPLDVTYSYTEMWDDRPTIQIWDDYTTIDGVTYTDIWLSNEAASKFKTDGMDFATAYDIASNTNGTFVSGEGYFDGVPIFMENNELQSQWYSQNVPAFGEGDTGLSAMGYGTIQGIAPTGPGRSGFIRYTPSNSGMNQVISPAGATDSIQLFKYNNNWRIRNQQGYSAGNYSNLYVASPFDFDWVAGTIDPTPLPSDQGLMLRIPSNRIPDIQDFLTDNPEFEKPGGTTIDVNVDPDIMTKLDDLIDIIAPIIPIINNIGDVQFTVNHTEPQPEPSLPDTVFPDTQVDDALQPIIYTINNNTQNIIENIPAPSEVTQPIIQEIQNTGDEIIENIPKIDEICNNIDTAPYHDLDTGLNRLPTVFLPFISDLRSALGIWHYVTEWISQISTTFAFVTGCLVGTSIMTPIYAAIAGFMCIKVYRRMTS